MPATWKLRNLLKERGVNCASEISRIVREQTGYQLSVQAVCDLLNGQPKMIRLKTIQALCDAFYFRLSDCLEVLPTQKPQKNTRSVERAGLRNGPLRETESHKSAERGRDSSVRRIDFAAFYPDARKFHQTREQREKRNTFDQGAG